MAKCPHCDTIISLDSLHKEVRGALKKEVMYSCPSCDKVLGFAFFFGGMLTGRP
ncbi:MAG: hypothetical protein JXR94_19630 [Candidatus Hydrogenedentes bacterium]|nr:hypothetical protein [Candidatus Hydrogenedentota bacterium]